MATSPKDKATGLETRDVFLDTEVYRRYGHNLNDRILQTLLKLTKDHVCTLHITDITLSEIMRQLGDLAIEVAQVVNKSNRQLRNWRAVRAWHSKQQGALEDLDVANLTQDAISQFNYLMTVDWQPTKHIASEIPAKDIFESYFRREPPFDKQDSKEFPDAFVVMALDRWCQSKHQKMYVVTKDKAMLRAVERTKTLIPVPTLEDYLALRVENPQIVSKVERILESKAWDTVETHVREHIGELGTVYSGNLHDGEIVDHRLSDGSITLEYFHIISASDDQIELVAKVKTPVSFDVQYMDTSSAWWDSEEKDFFGGETETVTFEEEVVLSLLVVIDSKDDSISDINVLTQDINLEEPSEDFY